MKTVFIRISIYNIKDMLQLECSITKLTIGYYTFQKYNITAFDLKLRELKIPWVCFTRPS